MSQYNLIFINEDQEFFNKKLQSLKDKQPFFSSQYSPSSTHYYRQLIEDKGFKVDNISLLILKDNDVIWAFQGFSYNANGVNYTIDFDIPSIFIESAFLTTADKKKIAHAIDEHILKLPFSLLRLQELSVSQYVSFSFEYILSKDIKYTLNHSYKRIIDLSFELKDIRSQFRKSYLSLINRGLRNLDINIYTTRNIQVEHIYSLRDLHIQEAGRETRSLQSWMAQFNMIKNSEGFLILAMLENRIVSGGLFLISSKHCHYAVSASDRSLFNDMALFHPIMQVAICTAKELDARYFETGPDFISEQKNKITEKLNNISIFKRGFGGRLYPYYELVIEQ